MVPRWGPLDHSSRPMKLIFWIIHCSRAAHVTISQYKSPILNKQLVPENSFEHFYRHFGHGTVLTADSALFLFESAAGFRPQIRSLNLLLIYSTVQTSPARTQLVPTWLDMKDWYTIAFVGAKRTDSCLGSCVFCAFVLTAAFLFSMGQRTISDALHSASKSLIVRTLFSSSIQ